ncbi:MAG: SUMF1/EgtB/PvdO family nonheme iron enzyme [Bacteroidota bacterium]
MKRMRTVFCSLLVLLTLSVSHVYSQSRPETFWDDVRINAALGINNFHGDFDRLNGTTGDLQGLFFPIEGMNASLTFSKPMPFLENPSYDLNIYAGADIVTFRSKSVGTTFLPTNARVGLTPINIINRGYGPKFGLSFEYRFNDKFSIEPFVEGSYRLHNPQTDGLLSGTEIVAPSSVIGSGGNPPYDLADIPETRVTPNEDDAIKSGILGGMGGVRINKQFLGHYKWFAQYSFLYFLDDYFDNTSEGAGSGNGTDQNDSMTLFSVGVSYPIVKEKRRTEEVTQKRVRLDKDRIAKIERIQNIANLVTTDEDLRELQRIMSDKILLYDTPGVRFNELAAEAEDRQVQLADSDIMTDMVEVPGGSYIMGLTAVDELNIQVQGRKRITINPFRIDKYEVSNKQYRAFLVAMGAINAPSGNISLIDTSASSMNYGSAMDWNELLTRANLDNYREHTPTPELNGPEDLMPDSTQWKQMGLDDVIPWSTYFYNDYYDNFPVVCVNWYQAKLFAAWAGKRLPTESEWEYVARSGISGRVYPWDGLEVQTKTGKYRANFKQDRGVYQADGYAIMAPVESFVPNDFGLYNVAGNVSEWVLDSYNPSYVVLQNVGTSNFVSPSYVNASEPRKIHRGGSWQSTKFFIGVGVRNFQVKSQGTPFIGFRCAQSVSRRYR